MATVSWLVKGVNIAIGLLLVHRGIEEAWTRVSRVCEPRGGERSRWREGSSVPGARDVGQASETSLASMEMMMRQALRLSSESYALGEK